MEKYNYIIGIDPGASGGIASTDGQTVSTAAMPSDLTELGTFLQWVRENYVSPLILLEKINIRHDDLAERGKVFRIQKMIENYANLKAVITLSGIPLAEVHPLTWQSRLGLRKTGEEKAERKRRYKEVAQRHYPSVKATMKTCDALLIMRYGCVLNQSDAKKDKKWLSDNIAFRKSNILL